MNPDDPEQRVADLERQLGQRPGAMGRLTPDQVRGIEFGAPRMGKRGYNEDEVDAFLDALAAALSGHGTITADQVSGVAFGKPPIGRRGYNEDEVDAFLGHVERQLRAQQGRSPATPGLLSEFRPPPTSHAKEPDAFEGMFGIDRKSFLLAAAIGVLALIGMGLTVLSKHVPAMNEPAPSFVGPLFLVVVAAVVVIGLVRHFRNR